MEESTHHVAKQFITVTYSDWLFFTGDIQGFKFNQKQSQNNFRYGGWYTDTDTVTIRKTTHFENTAALSGLFVANGNLIFSRGSKFLKELLVRADLRYTGKGEQLN